MVVFGRWEGERGRARAQGERSDDHSHQHQVDAVEGSEAKWKRRDDKDDKDDKATRDHIQAVLPPGICDPSCRIGARDLCRGQSL